MCYCNKVKILEYLREDGSSPYKRWFDTLPAEAAAKVTVAKLRLERGVTSAIKWLDGGVGEYKIDWGPGYRIYLAKDGADLIVLFGGGTKKGQNKDILAAQALCQEYKARKAQKRKEEERKRQLEEKNKRKR
jgi:putative addiction module killer protein